MVVWKNGCYNQDIIVQKVINGLLHPRFPCCWNLIIPPGFGDVPLGEALERSLRSNDRCPLLAVLSSDEVHGLEALLDKLHRQWLHRPRPKSSGPEEGDVALDRLLDAVYRTAESTSAGKDGRPVILVLKRFHKLLDHLQRASGNSDWILGKLRTEEQAHRLRTVTLTYIPYKELKRRWESRNHFFSVSEYGDTHNQDIAQPVPLDAVRELAADLGIPQGVAEILWQMTGGYPDVLLDIVATWERESYTSLNRSVRERLFQQAVARLERFVKWLDPVDDRRVRDHLIRFHFEPEDEEAFEVLRTHPWKDVLLRENVIRAECLGAAALRATEDDAREELRVPPVGWTSSKAPRKCTSIASFRAA